MRSPSLLLVLPLLLLAGCSTYTQATNSVTEAKLSGQVDVAARQAAQMAKAHAQDRDAIVYALEAGSAERALALAKLPPPPVPPPAAHPNQLGDGGTPATPPPAPPSPSDGAYQQAVQFLASADDRIDDYEMKAKHSVSTGLGIAVVNPATAPYRGEAYDKIMCSTYQALDYLALGQSEKARASLNKAYQRQKDAVEQNAARIKHDQEKIAQAKTGKLQDERGKKAASGFDVSRAENDPKASAALRELNASIDARTKAYADVNPFTSLVDGLFLLANSTDAQEQERAAVEFGRLAAIDDTNSYLKQDALTAQALASGKAMPPTTYVIFESGEAPHREEVLIPVPLFLFTTNELLFTQVPISRLSYNDQFNASLTVTGGTTTAQTETVCDMDCVISREFKNELPSMWIDGLACAATKAIIQHQLDRQIDRSATNVFAAALMKAAVLATNVATTRADTRTWRGLPKTFSYARLSTPADNTLTVSTPDGQSKQVSLPAAQVVVVYVKQVRPGTALLVDSFKLIKLD